MNTRFSFLIMLVPFAALLGSPGNAIAASRQPGGSGLGFSCDVNTQKCECQGVETGADCVAMKKNCVGDLTCLDPINYPGQPYRCTCRMSRSVSPSAIRPKVNGAVKLAPKQ